MTPTTFSTPLPAGPAVISRDAVAAAMRSAWAMVAGNQNAAADPDLTSEEQYGAAQAAFGQQCLLALFAPLIGETVDVGAGLLGAAR